MSICTALTSSYKDPELVTTNKLDLYALLRRCHCLNICKTQSWHYKNVLGIIWTMQAYNKYRQPSFKICRICCRLPAKINNELFYRVFYETPECLKILAQLSKLYDRRTNSKDLKILKQYEACSPYLFKLFYLKR